MDQSRTVIEAKAAFLRQQIRLLTTTLQPTSQWRENAPEIEGPELSDKVIEDVIDKVNTKIKQHNRLVYNTESTRHVAEQIDALYWNAISKAGPEPNFDSEVELFVKKNSDLTSDETIRSLPSSLRELIPSTGSGHYTDEDSDVYTTRHSRLADLATRRTTAQNKLEQLRSLKTSLAPYQDPHDTIQPNLVSRNGELGKELDKMRILLARVTGALQQANGSDGDMNMGGVEVSNEASNQGQSQKEKLAAIMDVT